MEALQHLLLEDVLHNLKCYQSSKLKVELLPALRRRKQLPWNQLYRGHLPQPIMNHSPYSFFFWTYLYIHRIILLFAQKANLYVKHSCHQILVYLSLMNRSVPFLPSFTFMNSWIPRHFVIPGNELANKADNNLSNF